MESLLRDDRERGQVKRSQINLHLWPDNLLAFYFNFGFIFNIPLIFCINLIGLWVGLDDINIGLIMCFGINFTRTSN